MFKKILSLILFPTVILVCIVILQNAEGKEPGSATCLLEGSKILVEDGEMVNMVNIEKIKEGDKIIGFDSFFARLVEVKVIKKTVHRVQDYYRIELLNNRIIKVTGNHLVATGENTFKKVEDLDDNDFLFTLQGLIKIKKIEHFRKFVTVYNLEVEKPHNYFVEGILVHNKQAPPETANPPESVPSHSSQGDKKKEPSPPEPSSPPISFDENDLIPENTTIPKEPPPPDDNQYRDLIQRCFCYVCQYRGQGSLGKCRPKLFIFEDTCPCEDECFKDEDCTTIQKYSCNSLTGQCYADNNGQYTSLAVCKDNCRQIPPSTTTTTKPSPTTSSTTTTTKPTKYYECDYSTGKCNESLTNQGFPTLKDCQDNCHKMPCSIIEFSINGKTNKDQNPLKVWVNTPLKGYFSVNNVCTQCVVKSNDTWGKPQEYYDITLGNTNFTKDFKISSAGNYSFELKCSSSRKDENLLDCDPTADEDCVVDSLSLQQVQAINLPFWHEIIPVLPGFLRGLFRR